MKRPPPQTLNHLRLIGVRFAWLVLAVFSIAAFYLSFPHRYSQLTGVAIRLRFALAEVGLSQRFLAQYLSAADVVMMAGCVLIALVLVLKRFDDWMAVFVALLLFVYGVTITRPVESFVVMPIRLRWLLFTTRAAAMWYFLALCYLFPDGRFVPRWTRIAVLLWGLVCMAWLFFPEMPYNLVYFDTGSDEATATLMLFLAVMATGLYAQAYRYRRVSTPLQRQQTKLVVLGIAAAILGIVAFLMPASIFPEIGRDGPLRLAYVMIGVPALYLFTLFVPFSITFSILRYRLWDIDVIIRRTLVYSTLTATLALVYFISVVGLEQLIQSLTRQTEQSQLAIILSTLVIAALFSPLRSRLQDGIDRRFYRRRYDAEQALQTFAATIREEVDLNQLSNHLVHMIENTMQPESVSLWLKEPGEGDRL